MKEFILCILICLKIRQKMLRIYSFKLGMMTWWLYREMFTMNQQPEASQEKLLRQSEKYM